ncbi:MAG: hypothetical protein QM719_06915 [Thermomonas sp.]
MRVRKLALATLAVSVALSAAGCKRASEAAADAAIAAASGGKVNVSHDGDTTTIKSADGKGSMTVTTGDDAKLPASFPKDVYLPGDYKVESALEMPGAIVTHVLTQGSVASVSSDADKGMQAQGWKQTMTMAQSEQTHIVMWEKGERHATLTIAGDSSQGGVQVGYQLATSKQ